MKTKKYALLIAYLIMCAIAAYSSAETSMFGFIPGGTLGGGLRFDIGKGMVTDIALTAGSGNSGSTYSVLADVFRGCWGVGGTFSKAAVNSAPALAVNIQYAVEYKVHQKVILGISAVLINFDTDNTADPNITVLPAIMPYIVMPL